mmetsp:Transcript_30628/g.84469  ORF Transcript_30628/g.84469 Transcript_30628/m.84469 type:complete len:287 (+) Transcript_30628:1436-2296(+)
MSWSTACSVRTDSTRPMAASEAANGRHLAHVSHLPQGTVGTCHGGAEPWILDTSFTMGVDQPFGRRITHSYPIARSRPMSDGGITFAMLTLPSLGMPSLRMGIFGNSGIPSMKNITMRTSTTISQVVLSCGLYHSLWGRKPKSTGLQPDSSPGTGLLPRASASFPSSACGLFWKVSSCDMKMTTARPLKKPRNAVFGMSFTRFAQRHAAHTSWMIPVSTITKKRYSRRSSGHLSPKGPLSSMTSLMTTASAPAQPEIMPGRPPRTQVIRPMKKEPYRPCMGCTPAT